MWFKWPNAKLLGTADLSESVFYPAFLFSFSYTQIFFHCSLRGPYTIFFCPFVFGPWSGCLKSFNVTVNSMLSMTGSLSMFSHWDLFTVDPWTKPVFQRKLYNLSRPSSYFLPPMENTVLFFKGQIKCNSALWFTASTRCFVYLSLVSQRYNNI